jgi:Flp pilus assembly protein TadG
MIAGTFTSRHRQRGTAVVETIVATPVLLFLVLIGAEITNAFVDHNTLTKSARHAVRYLAENAVQGTTTVVSLDADLVAETRNLLVFGNTAGAGAPILPGLAVGSVQVLDLGGNNVQVTITYPYNGILGNTLPAFGFGADGDLGFNLQATATMRAL